MFGYIVHMFCHEDANFFDIFISKCIELNIFVVNKFVIFEAAPIKTNMTKGYFQNIYFLFYNIIFHF